MKSTCAATYSAPFDQRPLTPVPLLVCGDKIACLDTSPTSIPTHEWPWSVAGHTRSSSAPTYLTQTTSARR